MLVFMLAADHDWCGIGHSALIYDGEGLRSRKFGIYLRFGIAELFSKCCLVGLGVGLTGLDCSCSPVGGIEEELGSSPNLAVILFIWIHKTHSSFYNVGFHAGGLS